MENGSEAAKLRIQNRFSDMKINKEMYDSENQGKNIEIQGRWRETQQYADGIDITRIKITDENGSKVLQKPLGNYITLEVQDVVDGEEERKEQASRAVAIELKRLIRFHKQLKVLIIGLGTIRSPLMHWGHIRFQKSKYPGTISAFRSCGRGWDVLCQRIYPWCDGLDRDGNSRFD